MTTSRTNSRLSSASHSSSAEFGHEPFVDFRPRVLDLALRNIWPDASPEEIDVEQIPGGGFNRVVGISRRQLEQPGSCTRYIIRLPRFNRMKLDNQVATLRLLRERGRIPVPEVIRFDQSTENELNARYMIQNRVPGIELYKGYPRLDWRAKYRLARELGHVYRELLATYSDAPGALVLPVDHSAKFELVPWHRPRVARTREYNDSPVLQDLYKILVDIFIARKESYLRRWPNKTDGPRLMDRFCVMASELSERGWFEDCRMSLEHFDITPRNIIVHPEPSTGNPVISGIIDWDQAVFAPHFVCCKPPAWLWTWLAGSNHDGFHAHEQLAPGEPPTPEGRKLKRIFDESAGLEYVRFAYTPAYRLARLLVYITIRGLVWQNHIEAKETNWVYKLGNEVISCWATISGDKERGWRRRKR